MTRPVSQPFPRLRRRRSRTIARVVRTLLASAAILVSAAAALRAQAPPAPEILVVPFEAQGDPRAFWLGEASAILLEEALADLGHAVVPREARVELVDRLGLPATGALTYASAIRIARFLGAPQVMLGTSSLDEDGLTVSAHVVDLIDGRVRDAVTRSQPLRELFDLHARLARQLTQAAPAAPELLASRQHPDPEAFEDYVKGLLAPSVDARIRLLTEAIEREPAYTAARLALWQVHTTAGNHAAALDVALAIDPGGSDPVPARFAESASLIALGRLDESFERLSDLSDRAPDEAAVFNNLGVVQLRRGAGQEGGWPVFYFHRAVELAPHVVDFCFNLGYAYWLAGDADAAIYWLTEAVRRDPGDAEAHHVLGAALDRMGRRDQARLEAELAAELSSDFADRTDTRVAPGLERLVRRHGGGSPAGLDARFLEGARREHADLALFHLERARRLLDEGRLVQAVDEARRAVFLTPYGAEASLLLGRILLRLDRVDDAVEALNLSLWSAETVEAHVALATALSRRGDAQGAAAEVEAALAIDPGSVAALALQQELGAAGVR